jgi:hypothetical protein
VRNAFIGIIESFQLPRYEAKTWNRWIFFRSLKQSLQTNTYSKEWFSRADVLQDRFSVGGLCELAQTVAEMTDTG